MSRTYQWFVNVRGLTKPEAQAAEAALDVCSGLELEVTEWRRVAGEVTEWTVQGAGVWSIGGGQSEEAEARELRQQVWRAVGRFVDVAIGAIYIEEPDAWHRGTEEECREYLDGLPRCERCGAILAEACEDDGLCERCDLERPHYDSPWCEVCHAWIDTDDPDASLCPACAIDAAQSRLEER